MVHWLEASQTTFLPSVSPPHRQFDQKCENGLPHAQIVVKKWVSIVETGGKCHPCRTGKASACIPSKNTRNVLHHITTRLSRSTGESWIRQLQTWTIRNGRRCWLAAEAYCAKRAEVTSWTCYRRRPSRLSDPRCWQTEGAGKRLTLCSCTRYLGYRVSCEMSFRH